MAAKKKDDYNEDEPMVITLEYEDGTEMETEVYGIFEVDGNEYIALIPDDDSDDVYIYGHADIGEDEYDPELRDIEDEDEFKRVVKVFDEIMEASKED